MAPYFACKVDPRFSEDGKFFDPDERFTRDKTIREKAINLIFHAKARLSFDKNERKVRQLYCDLCKTEQIWAKTTEFAFTEESSVNSLMSEVIIKAVFAQEGKYLKIMSKLRAALQPSLGVSDEKYTHEPLTWAHHIEIPQKKDWEKEYVQPDVSHEDLVRAHGAYLMNPHYNNGTSLINHHDFIKAVGPYSEKLMRALRDYRSTINDLSTDVQCAHSFKHIREKLITIDKTFNIAWKAYLNSHDALKEMSPIFAAKDHFEPWYAFYERCFKDKSLQPLITTLSNTDEGIQFWSEDKNMQKKENISSKAKETLESCYRSLEETIRTSFPKTRTAALLSGQESQISN
jgi:hypothetical protein